jgi:hypothetical protein
MPYCRDCGREIEDGNWLCPSCQYQQQYSTQQPQTVIVQQGGTNADQVIGALFLIALLTATNESCLSANKNLKGSRNIHFTNLMHVLLID